MKIGIDASPLMVSSGGIRRYTENLILSLSQIDSQNDYMLFGAPPRRCPPLRANFRCDGLTFPFKNWVDLLYLVGSADRIDFFHGTNYSSPLLDRRPSVLTVHDLTVHLFPESHPWMRRLWHRLLPTLCRRSARIIADSFNTKNDLVRLYGIPERQIDVIHLAAGPEFKPIEDVARLERVRRRHSLPDSFVLFVGSLEPRKKLETLIESMSIARKRGVPQHLVIAGDGDRRYRDQLRAVARRAGLDTERDVVFTGFVDDADLPALYSLSELFVFPSIYEGFGLPPLEAMSCGVPVILPNNSSFRELYSDCSMMIDEVVAGVLADAIQAVLEDAGLRSSLVKKGMERARSRAWESVAAETLEVYERATAGD